ncbi:MAG: AbrB/MazE/SpoVT family DNA-binding domain-containing protein [Bacillota bacterium]
MDFEVAKVTSKGQVTIPKAVRDKLRLKEGDRVIFLEADGKIVIENAALLAFKRLSEEVAPEIEKMGVTEGESTEWLEEVRKEKWEKRQNC